MNSSTCRPPKVLLVHTGSHYQTHLSHLSDAGLHVAETCVEDALVEAIRLQPDMIMLEFGCDSEVTTQLKGQAATEHIPVIALGKLTGRTVLPFRQRNLERTNGEPAAPFGPHFFR